MPSSVKCLGCDTQKKSRTDKFYNVKNEHLLAINNLRCKYNEKKRKLDVINDVPVDSKICKTCYNSLRSDTVTNYSPLPDLTIYRKGINSHSRCVFGCRDPKNHISVSNKTRKLLLMSYKFLVELNSRICSEHLNEDNYWPLVKQISTEVTLREQKIVSDLMFEYYQEPNEKIKHNFDIDNLNSIDDKVFKAWFGFTKDQFLKVCDYSKDSKPKDIAILLCKLRTSLSNEQLGYLFNYISESSITNHIQI